MLYYNVWCRAGDRVPAAAQHNVHLARAVRRVRRGAARARQRRAHRRRRRARALPERRAAHLLAQVTLHS